MTDRAAASLPLLTTRSLLTAAAIISLAVSNCPGATVAAGQVAPLAPPLEVIDLAGKPVDLKSAVVADGNGAALLVFWASWCGPCLHEIPVLRELHHYYAPRGLRVIGLGVKEGGDTPEAISRAVASNGVDYPVLFDGGGKAEAAFGVGAIPTAVLIDGKGVVKWSGTQLPSDINQRIKEALGPSGDSAPK